MDDVETEAQATVRLNGIADQVTLLLNTMAGAGQIRNQAEFVLVCMMVAANSIASSADDVEEGAEFLLAAHRVLDTFAIYAIEEVERHPPGSEGVH